MNFIAALDIGSNTVKTLVMCRGTAGRLQYAADWCEVTGLGHGLRGGLLAEDSMRRSRAGIVRQICEVRRRFPAAGFSAVATSAVREAANGPEFLHGCEVAAGLPEGIIRVLTGEEEAAGTFAGAAFAFAAGSRFVNADPGGGSTEITAGRAGSPPQDARSLKLGCVRWTDRYSLRDIAAGETLEEALEAARELVRPLAAAWHLPQDVSLSVTGGTAHALASVAAGKIYAMFEPMPPMSATQLRNLLERMAGMTAEERQEMPGMPPMRAEVMTAGAGIVLAVMECFGFDSFLPNPYGLRYALLQNALRPLEK